MGADRILRQAVREDRAISIARWVIGLTILLVLAVIAGPWIGLLPRWLPPGTRTAGSVLLLSGAVLAKFVTGLPRAALVCSTLVLGLLGLATWFGLLYTGFDYCQVNIPVTTGVNIDVEVNLISEQLQCTYQTSHGSEQHRESRIWTALN